MHLSFFLLFPVLPGYQEAFLQWAKDKDDVQDARLNIVGSPFIKKELGFANSGW